MREILFRGKRKNNGEWVEGYYIHIPEGEGTYDEERHLIQQIHNNGIIGFSVDVIPETVGQYTGLTDKNGKKIFEGDIVEVTYLTRCYDNETEIREVTYNEEECCYYPMRWNETCEVCDYFTEIQSIEIIGNIHDNPELLKGGAQE